MSYYQGDYYTGDPGFFGSLGRFAKGVLGAGIRSIPGVGALVSGVGSIMRSPLRKGISPYSISYGPGSQEYQEATAYYEGRVAKPQLRLPPMPGGALTLGPPQALAAAGPRPGPCIRMSPRGRRIRINCRTGKAIRHMRVTNPKALRRAIRRANGFAKLARKVMHFVSPRAPKGRAIFRKRRRK